MKIRRIAISRDGVVSFSSGYSVVKAELEAILVKIIVLPEEESLTQNPISRGILAQFSSILSFPRVFLSFHLYNRIRVTYIL